MIDFGMMEVEGFASIEKEKFNWGIQGLNIIQAPNGFGKTKFINALVWCLYGKTLSGSVEPWERVRGEAYQGTKVKVEVFSGIEIAATITRYKDYKKFRNRLVVTVNNEELTDLKEKKDIQTAINGFLGYSYELFKNSIIFGQKLKRLIAETGPNKKKVFDDAFELSYIPKAKKINDTDLAELIKQRLDQELKVEKLRNDIHYKEDDIVSSKILIKNFRDDQAKAINPKVAKRNKLAEKQQKLRDNLNHTKFKNLEERHLDAQNRFKGLKKLNPSATTMLKLNGLKVELGMNLKRWEQDLINTLGQLQDLSTTDVSKICDKCGNKLTSVQMELAKKDKKEELGDLVKKIEEVKTNKTNNQNRLEEVASKISSAKKTKSLYDTTFEEVQTLGSKFGEYLEIEKDLKRVKKEIKELIEEIREMRKRTLNIDIDSKKAEVDKLYLELKPEKKKLRKLTKAVEVKKWVSDKALSNSGLKAFIFEDMMDLINDRLEYYSRFVGFQVAFAIDMESHHKDIKTFVFKGDDPVPYEDLSGGQQQSVDIASAFAIHDVVSASKNCSLLVMDELFESLDKDNIEIMTELIQDKANDKCLYLVTHRSEFCPTNSNIIRVLYNNGITSLS